MSREKFLSTDTAMLLAKRVSDSEAALWVKCLAVERDDILKALETVIRDKAPSYHDCVDDGLPDCAWCIAMNAITRVYGEELNDE